MMPTQVVDPFLRFFTFNTLRNKKVTLFDSNGSMVCSFRFSPEWLASVSDDMWVHVQDCLNDTTV